MRAVNIEWDVTDSAENITQEEANEILSTLPTEVELPERFSAENYMVDGELDEDWLSDDVSDYLSNTYEFCHYGFTLTEIYQQ